MSTRPRTFRCEGVVLRHYDLGEADRLLTFLTPDRGLVRAAARGARKTSSKIGGHLDLLKHVSLSLAEGKTLYSVSQAEAIEGFRKLRTDLARLSSGLYLAELAERFSVEDAPGRPVFDLLLSTLGRLEVTPTVELLTRWYEVRMLHLSGFMPELARCSECGDDLAQDDHIFSAERGGLMCPRCRSGAHGPVVPANVSTVKLLRHLARSDWPAVEGLRVTEETMRQAERILREHMRYVLDHRIMSVAFMDEVRKQRAGPR